MINSSTLFLGYLVIYLVDIEPTLMLEHLKVHFIEKMKIFRGLQRAQVSIPGWNYAQQWVEGERNDLRCEYFHIPKATLLSTGITQTSLGSLRGTLLLKGWKKKCWCCNGPNWYSNVNPRANSQQLFLHPSLLPYFPKVFVGSTGMALVFFLGGDVWNDRGSSFLTIMRSGFASR